MGFLKSLKGMLTPKADDETRTAPKASAEEKAIQEVERLPVFSGHRATSSWVQYKINVTPKNAWIAIGRANTATEWLNTTTSPMDYREHWEEAIYYMSSLARIEGKMRFKGEHPSAILRRMKLEYNQCLFEFLERYAKNHQENRIAPLKTKKGKLNRAKEFLPGLDEMWSNMTKDGRARAEELAALEVAMIEGGEI